MRSEDVDRNLATTTTKSLEVLPLGLAYWNLES